jgi:hypothetical protein
VTAAGAQTAPTSEPRAEVNEEMIMAKAVDKALAAPFSKLHEVQSPSLWDFTLCSLAGKERPF